MSIIELDRLLREISAEAPSGEEDLEHDSVFMEIETESQGTPAVEVEGKIVQEAREPNWQKIQKSALGLLTRAHDLRLAVYLASSLLHTDGIQGLRDGLGLIRGYVERYWESVYPQLDPEDDNDPTLRINVLEALGDWNTVIGPLMKTRLCFSRSAGEVNLRQYRIAAGKAGDLFVSDEEKKNAFNPAGIDGAFSDCDLEQLKGDTEAAGASLEALTGLRGLLEEKVGSDMAPDLDELAQVLKDIDNLLKGQLARRTGLSPPAPEKPDKRAKTVGPAVQESAPYEQPSSPGGRSFGMVESREDVLEVLEQVCTYYELFEPASPVPLLLKRAMRLVEKNFFEIMEDLAPESLSQVEMICGAREQK